jgi:glycosyltransferase XagB
LHRHHWLFNLELCAADIAGHFVNSGASAISARRQPIVEPWMVEFAFLGASMDAIEYLRTAHDRARQWGVPVVAALLAGGRYSEDTYVHALAAATGSAVAGQGPDLDAQIATIARSRPLAMSQPPLIVRWHGKPAWLIVSTNINPAEVRARIAWARAMDTMPVLVSGRTLDRAFERCQASARIKQAKLGLKRRWPFYSAAQQGPAWQRNTATAAIGVIVGSVVIYPPETLAFLSVLLTIPFLGTVFVRAAALVTLFRPPAQQQPYLPSQPDSALPVYSILVALFDEAAVLPRLVTALSAIDYPAAKLDCLLIIEDVDTSTKAALLDIDLPSFMRIVIVPEGEPQTKPRALNYALSLARGEFVVIYDAEDRPEKDQLRRALLEFQRHGPNLACVQSCLNIFNVRQSWLTRQFTVEYSALFDSILPALQWLRIPMPLGGTSNHFPRAVLEKLQGWDPYNVTEDADLGIRIARLGYDVAAISSTTWEEAPATFKMWRNQRTRWIKGWIQTYLVHTRHPFALWRDLGTLRTLGFHFYMGGLILSALVHPIFYLIVAADSIFDVQMFALSENIGLLFWLIAVGNLLTGYLVSMIVGVVSVHRRKHRLTLSALMMPIYWLLISFAAYRALWQLYRDPFRWEKTPHGLAEEHDEVIA